jgi:uncharacterized membrane protein YphA (DoxX/SURF4 family)
MTTTVRARPGNSSAISAATALRLLAVMLGVFFLFQGLNKLEWFLDSGIFAAKMQAWLKNAPAPTVRWYLETVAMPGVPLFARLVPLAELTTGVSLIVGFWPRVVAALAFMMVLNFHFGLGSFFSVEFLRDGAGLPVLGGLLAIVVGGSRLPWSVRP